MAYLRFILNLMVIILVQYCKGRVAFPCGNESDPNAVVGICSSRTVAKNSGSGSIVLKVSSMDACKCVFLIINQTNTMGFLFKRWNDLNTSTPSVSCGVSLTFEIDKNNVWVLDCKTDTLWNWYLNLNEQVIITTKPTNGNLMENEGYCIDLTVRHLQDGQFMQLECGVNTLTNTVSRSTQVPSNTKISTTENENGPSSSTSSSTKECATTATDEPLTSIDHTQPISQSSTTDGTTSLRENSTIRDNNTSMNTAIGASVGGILVLVAVVVFIVIFKRRRQKDQGMNSSIGNEHDYSTSRNDGLLYNVLYESAAKNANTGEEDNKPESQVNYIPVDYDGNYSAVEPDGFQTPTTSTEIDLPKGNQKPKIAKKPEHLQKKTKQLDECSNGDKDVKHLSVPGNDGCEYALVDKKKDIKRTERPSSTLSNTTASGDVYASVQKSKTLPASSMPEGQGSKM